MKELQLTENRNMTAMDVQSQVNLIQEVMKQVMKKDVHYGVIPGCGDKPTLYKPGADKISMTFKLGAEYEELPGSIEGEDYVCYKINCKLFHIPTGTFVGTGRGVCNSKEKKYRTRSVYANKATDAEKAIGELVEGKYPRYIIPQDPHDIMNTLYKMACKRAHIAAVLTATAASDIFTQDIEDLPEGTVLDAEPQGKPAVKEPQKKATSPKATKERMFKAFEVEKERLGTEIYSTIIGSEGFTDVSEMSVEDGKRIIGLLRTAKVTGENNEESDVQ